MPSTVLPRTFLASLVHVPLEHFPLDEQECGICTMTYRARGRGDRTTEYAVRLPCNHIYGKNCLAAWLANHSTCPTCRQDLPIHHTRPQAPTPPIQPQTPAWDPLPLISEAARAPENFVRDPEQWHGTLGTRLLDTMHAFATEARSWRQRQRQLDSLGAAPVQGIGSAMAGLERRQNHAVHARRDMPVARESARPARVRTTAQHVERTQSNTHRTEPYVVPARAVPRAAVATSRGDDHASIWVEAEQARSMMRGAEVHPAVF